MMSFPNYCPVPGTGILCQIHPDSSHRHCDPAPLRVVARTVADRILPGIRAVPESLQNLPTVRY